MRSIRLSIVLGVLTALLLASLPAALPAHARPAEQGLACAAPLTEAPPGTVGTYARAQNAFGFRLLNALVSASPAANTFISPTSLALALSMAYDGARGSTASAMASALGMSGMTRATVRQQAASLLARLQSSGSGAGLSVANSLWARKGVSFKPAFLTHLQQSYGASARALDFASPDAPATINRWVSCATGGKIASIITRIQPEEVMFLLDAVYFHGDWAQTFDPSGTRTQPFTTSTGSQVQAHLMTRVASFSYYRGRDFQAIRLPYANPRFAMTIVLPDRGVSLRGFARRITPASWSEWSAQTRQEPGSLSLPRFSIAASYGLNPQLTKLGMGEAFSRNADFSGMCVQRCFLTQVRHRTYLSVNEKGTVAAAVTSVGVGITAMPVTKFQMTVNHPFFVGIQDSATHAVLFTGLVTNPSG